MITSEADQQEQQQYQGQMKAAELCHPQCKRQCCRLVFVFNQWLTAVDLYKLIKILKFPLFDNAKT